MPSRFVILYHESPGGDHWDLMLETKDVLTTWALPTRPEEPISFSSSAVPLPDHRLHYLDYEGPVGNNRGYVRRIDAGTFRTLEPERFRLFGKLFDGILTVRTNADGAVTINFTPSKETGT